MIAPEQNKSRLQEALERSRAYVSPRSIFEVLAGVEKPEYYIDMLNILEAVRVKQERLKEIMYRVNAMNWECPVGGN